MIGQCGGGGGGGAAGFIVTFGAVDPASTATISPPAIADPF
jgi:hypothetical protein